MVPQRKVSDLVIFKKLNDEDLKAFLGFVKGRADNEMNKPLKDFLPTMPEAMGLVD